MPTDTDWVPRFHKFIPLAFSIGFLISFVLASTVGAQVVDGKIKGMPDVIDADILKFGQQRVILWGIDAPERPQKCRMSGKLWGCHEVAKRHLQLLAGRGEVTCVLGKNGVGKTTLLNAIMGLERVSSGEILLDDKLINNEPAYARSRSGVALVPQGRDIFSQLTVEENLRIGLSGLPRPEKIIPSSLFQYFPVLGEMLNRKGGDLSGGQQQQLAIARALVARPRVLLLDEPTEGIQPSIIKLITSVVKSLRDQGNMAIVLVEQYFEFAFELADKIIVMERGSVALDGEKADLNEQAVRKYLTV